MKGIGSYLAKRGSDGIISSSVAVRTNLFSSYNLAYVEGRMEFTESKPVSLSTLMPEPPVLNREKRRRAI